jgi:phosphoribosylformylglycinamidine synthase
VLRLPPRGGGGAVADERRGVAIATDGNGRWCALDPERGARLIVAEAARNVACTGARPLAATNCLNFGSPETPEVMGAFSATIDGMAAACLALGTPITGGNVSFYNATDGQSIHPTPIVGVLGTIDDCASSVPHTLRAAGDAIYIIGAVTRPGLGGSEYLWRTARRIAGRPAAIDLHEERRLHELLVRAAGDGLLSSAHDVATGGLLTTLVETCGDRFGAAVEADRGLPAHQWLFSESPTRVVVSVDQARSAELTRLCHDAGVACVHLGTATTERRLLCGGLLELDLDMVASAQARVLPDLLDAR